MKIVNLIRRGTGHLSVLGPKMSTMGTAVKLPLSEASAMLGVSQATLRNWIRLEIVEGSQTKPIMVEADEVARVKEKISTGEINKLASRANKSQSLSEKQAISHLSDKATQLLAVEFLKATGDAKTSNSEKLLLACLLVIKNDLGMTDFDGSVMTPTNFKNCGKTLLGEIEDWFLAIGKTEIFTESAVLSLDFSSEHEDLLGVIYQGLLNESEKSKFGSYYTPTQIVIDSIESLSNKSGKFLDPCCGTGQFLIQAKKLLKMPTEDIYGFDIDPLAVRISRFNLLRTNSYLDTTLNILVTDSIFDLANGAIENETNDLMGTFSLIATNPPYGAISGRKREIEAQYLTKSGEMFSLIIEKCLKLAQRNFSMSLILPESFLKVAVHQDIRKIVLGQYSLDLIVELGRPFPGVMSNIVQVNINEKTSTKETKVILAGDKEPHFIAQDVFKASKNLIFEYTNSSTDSKLLAKLLTREHEKIDSDSEWGLGIVTGNNKDFVSGDSQDGWRPVLTGKEVKPFTYSQTNNWILFDPKLFQQYPRNDIFNRPEKLFYKFISKNLVFSYDDRQAISLNSANVLVPNLKHMDIKVALAFLNSNVFQYIFVKKFGTYKVLKNHIMEMPFPLLTDIESREILELVNQILGGKSDYIKPINQLIYRIFNLSNDEISHIEMEIGA